MMTKDELLKKLIELDACSAGRQWAEKQPDMEVILRDCPQDWRMWAIHRGLSEFAERCDWSKLTGYDWSYLLRHQPQFAEHCDWSLLTGHDWSYLLNCQPQFAEHCDWSLLTGLDWSYLLRHHPQFAEHCDWSLLTGHDWSYLLRHQPQLGKYRTTKGEDNE